jgi:hypothetical protein
MLAAILLAIKREWQTAFGKIGAAVLAIGLLTFVGAYAALPRIQVRAGKFPRYFVSYQLETIGQRVLSHWETVPPKSLIEAREVVKQVTEPRTENIFLGGKTRDEDSPGNYLIRQSPTGFEFVWFDADGSPVNRVEEPSQSIVRCFTRPRLRWSSSASSATFSLAGWISGA